MDSIYIHVPFCISKCAYCDFYSLPYEDTLAERFVISLEKEISLYHEWIQSVRTLYIGGGTPSVLSPLLLERLLSVVERRLEFKDGYEFTVEVNPAAVTAEKIGMLKSHGVNRISLGVQSFSDSLLSTLGRVHNSRDAKDALRMVSGKFKNYSIDLIYGIPTQNAGIWQETLEYALSCYPPHIAAYELTPEEETPLYRDLKQKKLIMPGEDAVLEMYEMASSFLREKGYSHYEISNYCLPRYISLHNMNYWRRGEYLGFGPSAHSFFQGKRESNVAEAMRYCELIERGSLPVDSVTVPTPEEEIKETIFLGLRTRQGINLRDVVQMRGARKEGSVSEGSVLTGLSPYFDRGLIALNKGMLHLTEKGFPLSSTLIVEVMRKLRL